MTRKYIATITRTVDDTNRPIQFPFATEREAKKFAKAYTPPKMLGLTSACQICNVRFDTNQRNPARRGNCRNCGVCICENCSTRWGMRMVPRTFLNTAQSLTVRACKSCDWLSNAFCMALIQGNYDDAVKLYETGNVNLRTCFADINGEAMFPVHCAVMGGSVALLSWLVDGHCCPVSVKRDVRTGKPLSIQTSAERTLIDIAMTGKKVKVEILRYLIVDKNMSLSDTKATGLASRTLEALLRAGVTMPAKVGLEDDDDDQAAHLIHEIESVTSGTTIDDACPLCCERQMDCVLIPCGHQICCQDCGKNLKKCPICKVDCSVLRIFRQ